MKRVKNSLLGDLHQLDLIRYEFNNCGFTHIWLVDLTRLEVYDDIFVHLVDGYRVDIQDATGQRSWRSATARALVKGLIAFYRGVAASSVYLRDLPEGWPLEVSSVEGCALVNFSLSYSDTLCALALSTSQNIAVDIEVIGKNQIPNGFIKHVYDQKAVEQIENSGGAAWEKCILSNWCLKEATLKLSNYLNRTRVSEERTNASLRNFVWDASPDGITALTPLLDVGVIAALVVQDATCRLNIFNLQRFTERVR